MQSIRDIKPVGRGPSLAGMLAYLGSLGAPTEYPAGGDKTFLLFVCEGGDEQAIDYAQKEIMPLWGRVFSDNRVTADEAAELAQEFLPSVEGVYQKARVTAQKLIEAVSNDGKITVKEAMLAVFAGLIK